MIRGFRLEGQQEDLGDSIDKVFFDFTYMDLPGKTEAKGMTALKYKPVSEFDADEVVAKNTTEIVTANDINFLLALQAELETQTITMGKTKNNTKKVPAGSPVIRRWIGSFFEKNGKLIQLMKEGNHKLADTVLIFDLPAGRCVSTGSCPFLPTSDSDNGNYCIGCYARKSELKNPATFPSRNKNFELANRNLDLLERMITDQLQKYEGQKAVSRIHSSGDFFNQEYVDMWARITSAHPDIFFYAYTKTNEKMAGDSCQGRLGSEDGTQTVVLDPARKNLDFSGFGENFSIIPSYIAYDIHDDSGAVVGSETGFNYGGQKFISDVAKTYPENNMENPGFIVINEAGDAYPIVGEGKVKEGDKVTKSARLYKDYKVWFCPATNPRLRTSKQALPQAGPDDLPVEDNPFGEPQEKLEEDKKKPGKHLVECGKDCLYCTSRDVLDKRVAFWAH